MDKRNSETYYDIEIEFEEALIKNGFVEDIFYLRDLKQRKLFISTNICQETVDDAIRHIMRINREDKGIARNDRKPIILYVTSNGGDVDAGFALVDVILSSETPVYVINQGYQYSMGFLTGPSLSITPVPRLRIRWSLTREWKSVSRSMCSPEPRLPLRCMIHRCVRNGICSPTKQRNSA